MADKLSSIPTNLIMGFLGVGKTTAILDLLQHKPANEHWAVLVNEFGKVGVDGAIFSAAGVSVKEIAGGCLCCALSVPFQVGVNTLLKQTRPDRLLIEPTGLGHPKKVLGMLTSDTFKQVLDVRASICLLDPEKLKDTRYTTNENFTDQIALADVLVANKMDLADKVASALFYQYAGKILPEKALIAQTTQGQLELTWLDIKRNILRQAVYPQAHRIAKMSLLEQTENSLTHLADGFQSVGYVFSRQSCFDYLQISTLLNQLKVERIKGIINTDLGWFIINGVDGHVAYTACSQSGNSRVELITQQHQMHDIAVAIQRCLLGTSE